VAQISFVGVVIAIVVMVVKDIKPGIAVLVSVAGGVCLLITVLPYMQNVYSLIRELSEKSGMTSDMISSLIKISGIAIITEFAAGVCVDSGEGALGEKIQFAGKLAILSACVPVISTVFKIAESLAK